MSKFVVILIMDVITPGAKVGMMDAYEYDYDKVGDIIEELHDKVGSPSRVNLTSLLNKGKVRVGINVYLRSACACVAGIVYFIV